MAQAVRLPVTVHVNMCYFSSTLFFFIRGMLFFLCGGKTLLFRGDGEFSFLFWSSVFDLLPGATVNKVVMATAGEEAKTYHVIEVYAAV